MIYLNYLAEATKIMLMLLGVMKLIGIKRLFPFEMEKQ